MESDMLLSFEETMANLADLGKPLSSSGLVCLSDLDSKELALFQETWLAIETKRRRQIISRMVDLAEDNFELDFSKIFRHCLKDEDTEVKCAAIAGLWENEETSLLIPLTDLLEQDSTDRVQATAAAALGKFAMLAELNKLPQRHTSRVAGTLLAAFSDTSKPLEVRRRALEAVAPLSTTEVTRAIGNAYQSDNLRLKASAIYAMGRNCSPSWLPLLLKELGSDEAELRYEAAGACGELEQEEATPHLVELTSDKDISVQLMAIQALGKIGGRAAKEHLERCLSHPDESIRDAARQALEELQFGEDPLNAGRPI
ncbi:MAG TPA: HEAT repeat domain-containing protein [Dehalococcoidia bacterium]|nr:HEAT repeat domain-containing protein [Dehalococcoidia bacterium]